jgi:glucose-1-phosphate cytidylyltransferase
VKVVILAGGLGTRLSEETELKPKPMVEIGGKPILWHIMKIYSAQGFDEFIILTGYKAYAVKEYFTQFYLRNADVTVDLRTNVIDIHKTRSEPWKVTIVYTGQATQTGGRIKRAQPYIGDQPFMLTYGDGVADVNLHALIDCHRTAGKLASVTAVQPTGRFGGLGIDDDGAIHSFIEKPKGDAMWVSGGFFVLQPEVFTYITEGDSTIWERAPLENLAKDNQLNAYRHHGFWKPMDSLRDKLDLEAFWEGGNAPWKRWE